MVWAATKVGVEETIVFRNVTHEGRVLWRRVGDVPELPRRRTFRRLSDPLSWRLEVMGRPGARRRGPGLGVPAGEREGRVVLRTTAEGWCLEARHMEPARWRSDCRNSRCHRRSPVDPDVCRSSQSPASALPQYLNSKSVSNSIGNLAAMQIPSLF